MTVMPAHTLTVSRLGLARSYDFARPGPFGSLAVSMFALPP
jgi:hypothetical protein